MNKIRLLDDPILRKPCDQVDPMAIILKDLDSLFAAMHETMVNEKGVGLAANQIGRSLRIFILKDGEYFDDNQYRRYREFINPEIVSQSDLVDFEGEGCLSIPGVVANTKRYAKLTLKWIDYQGTNREAVFENLDAFAIQHEMDHLNGKLYIDQFGPLRRDMVVKKHRKYLKFNRS